jgi:hypothetical protein
MPTSPALVQLERLRRACDVLVRELAQALERALVAYEDPARAAEPFLSRLTQLEREGQQLEKDVPPSAGYVQVLMRQTRAQAEKLVTRATQAHRRRGQVDGRFQQSYNGVVGPALSRLPGQASGAARGQVERAMRQLVDQVVASPQVPGDVRSVMTRELTRWVLEQPEVEDAFFVVERSLMHVARFLHEKLTIHGELVALKRDTAGREKLSPAEAQAADQRAGALARRSVELDEQIARRLESGVTGHVRLSPRLVLDPSKRFLARLDADAGITIKKGDVRIDLGTRVQLTDPLLGSRGLNVTSHVDLRLRNDLDLTASHETTLHNGRMGNDQFKVSLTWRF